MILLTIIATTFLNSEDDQGFYFAEVTFQTLSLINISLLH